MLRYFGEKCQFSIHLAKIFRKEAPKNIPIMHKKVYTTGYLTIFSNLKCLTPLQYRVPPGIETVAFWHGRDELTNYPTPYIPDSNFRLQTFKHQRRSFLSSCYSSNMKATRVSKLQNCPVINLRNKKDWRLCKNISKSTYPLKASTSENVVASFLTRWYWRGSFFLKGKVNVLSMIFKQRKRQWMTKLALGVVHH